MTSKRYTIYISDEKLIEFLDAKSNISEFFTEIARDVNSGKLNESEGNIDLDIKKAKLEKTKVDTVNKKIDTEIKKIELSWMETSKNKPSPQAEQAIKSRVLNTIESVNLLKFITIKDDISGFRGTCDFCKWDIVETTTEKTQNELSRHLTACHSDKILENEISKKKSFQSKIQ